VKAAVLHEIGGTPRYEDVPEPVLSEGEELVEVTAAPVNAVDRALAAGTHYAGLGELPARVGIVGVGRLGDGTRVLFGSRGGTMAERVAVSREHVYELPDGVDDAVAAALQNPGLSAWLSLFWRATPTAGGTVLVLGATGVTGQLCVQLARRAGAGRVVAAGRNAAVLDRLAADGHADATIRLDGGDAEVVAALKAEAPFDLVVDYLWGRPTELLLAAIERHDLIPREVRTRLLAVGEMAGPTITLPAAVLRSAGLEVIGVGSGTFPPVETIMTGLGELLSDVADGRLRLDVTRVPLAEVAGWWHRDHAGSRTVFVP
jgi:NADPH:quinone reductase-like Zn-dependent oxidoreductase